MWPYWIEDVAVALVVNVCQSGSWRIWEQHSDADDTSLIISKAGIVIELIDVSPVLNQKVINLSLLQTKAANANFNSVIYIRPHFHSMPTYYYNDSNISQKKQTCIFTCWSLSTRHCLYWTEPCWLQKAARPILTTAFNAGGLYCPVLLQTTARSSVRHHADHSAIRTASAL